MQGTLIGDIGSTKAQWAWLGSDREVTFHTIGYNPSQHRDEGLQTMLVSVRAQCPGTVSRMFYYGTGVVSANIREKITTACFQVFDQLVVTCESDMLAAARSLSPGQHGVICILGTGSNSCLFDGKKIIQQIPSLGFPLGDEGSGADIGKACVKAFYYGLMPEDIRAAFAQVLPTERAVFLDLFHKHPTPNRFLAELVPLVSRYTGSAFIKTLVLDCFTSFIRQHVLPYQIPAPVHVTGGIAYAFRELLVDILLAEKLTPGTVVKSPLAGLIEYHQKLIT